MRGQNRAAHVPMRGKPLTPSFITAAAAAVQKSTFALPIASLPGEWRLRKVSAVAIPVGKGSFSALISWRFKGIAMNTPRNETAASQVIISHQASTRPVAR